MNRYLFSLLIVLLFVQTTSFAAHLKGGWIKYEYVGPGAATGTSRYNVTVYQYLDCNSTSQQVDQNIVLCVFNGNSLLQRHSVPLSGTVFQQKNTFQCIINPPVICYRIDFYNFSIEVPTGANGYTLAVQRCCRIANIVNIQNPGGTGVTYSVKIPGNGVSALDYQNKSAVFAQEDTGVVCRNNPFTFAFRATDPDLDSLRYRFIEGFGTPTATPLPDPASAPPYPAVVYTNPYSASQPMGSSVTINPATGLISGIAPGQTGDYVVAVAVDEFRDGQKIAETRKELHIRVESCDLPAALLNPRPTTCDGFTVNFVNDALPSSGVLKYYWDFGVSGTNSDTSTLPTPSFTYADTGVYAVKLVINRGDPCSDSAIQNFRVFPGFFPGFEYVGACKGIAFQFRDTSKTKYGVVDSWRWDFGDGTTLSDTSRVRNPQYSYPDSGTKKVSLVVTNSKGCIDTALVDITVLDKPVLTMAFKDTLICSIDTLQLHAIGMGNFTWSPVTRMINPTSADPFVNPLVTTRYTVELNDRGCLATDTVRVNVLDFITVDAGPDTTICLTDGISLRPNSQALSYKWTPTATLTNPNTRNPLATPVVATTTYYVTANLGKCQDRDSVTVRTVPYPRANAGVDTGICFTGKAILAGTAVGSVYAWSPANLVSNPNSLITDAFPKADTWFVLSVTETLGCPKPARDSVLVRVVPEVKVFAGNDTTVVIGQPLVFNSSASTFATIYSWTPATNINNPLILQPTAVIPPGFLPPGVDTLSYLLTATSPEGCTASDRIILKIFKVPPTIFVPSGFTPNADGKNDVIKPILAGMHRLDYFRIYNRYGQLVFQTSAIGKGWDGRIKGELQASASFVYTAQALDYNGVTVKATGMFTLIR
ncbi:MAG: PKD domain-containing protein [Bacteroidota bacterium]